MPLAASITAANALAIDSDHIALLKQCETFYPGDEAAAESIRVEQLEYTT